MNSLRLVATVGTAAFSLGAFAQQAPLPSGTSAASAPLRLEYRSAFEGYRTYQEPTARSWREVNEEAGLLGGHAGHLKPAATSAAPPLTKSDAAGATGTPPAVASPAVSATPASKPSSPGHTGHGK